MQPVFLTCFWLLAGGVALSLPFWLGGGDGLLAQLVQGRGETLAWFLRQYSYLPILAVSFLFFFGLLVAPLRNKFPLMRRLALVWLVVLVFGAGLFNQVLVKELVQRPRPRDVQTEQSMGVEALQADFSFTLFNKAVLQGNSFPSGHASAAFMLMVPFFVLWPAYKKTALAFLGGGLAYGFFVGWARMVLGAHYFTDVLWAGLLVLLASVLVSSWVKNNTNPKTPLLLFIALISILSIILFNRFNIVLHHRVVQATELNLPCLTDPWVPLAVGDKIGVRLQGYGGPLSTLQLEEKGGELRLNRFPGLFHSLSCYVKILEGA